MLLRLQKFDLEVTYKKGTEMVLADTLSRAYRVPQPGEPAAEATRGETEKDVESINMTQYIPMSEETQTRMQRATEDHGWSLRKEDVPVKVRATFHLEMSSQCKTGLFLRVKDLSFRHRCVKK